VRILVYDLVSENRSAVKGSRFERKIRNLRVAVTWMLHQLGIQCTESVILVPDTRAPQVEDVANRIMEMYSRVLSEAEGALGVALPRPVIMLLSITKDQFTAFRKLAERRLREMLEANIERVRTIAKNIDEIDDPDRARSLVSSLRRLKYEWLNIRKHVVDLRIGIKDDIDRLVRMIDDVIASLKG